MERNYWRGPHPNPSYWYGLRRYMIFMADHTCQWCGFVARRDSDLVLHHRHYDTFGKETPSPDDVVVVCKKCHAKTHGKFERGTVLPLFDPRPDDQELENEQSERLTFRLLKSCHMRLGENEDDSCEALAKRADAEGLWRHPRVSRSVSPEDTVTWSPAWD